MTRFITVDAELFEQLQKKVKEPGPCKFDCRKKLKSAFMAGHFAGLMQADYSPEEWKLMQEDAECYWQEHIER